MIFKKLAEVQAKLNVPKSLYNDFGKYRYRSCEDILSAVKPLLKEQGLVLRLEDKLIHDGDRYYIQATAILADIDEKDSKEIAVTAFAREELTKKKLDAAQITGAVSSYARKYALNGLFCIDDTKDPDATNTHGEETREEKPSYISGTQEEALLNKLRELEKLSDEAYVNCLKWIEGNFTMDFKRLTDAEWSKAYKAIERKVATLQNTAA